MGKQIFAERIADLVTFQARTASGQGHMYLPQEMTHVYVHLEIKDEYEQARSIEDARKFFRSVTRASMAAQAIAQRHGGLLLEIQGSLLHIALGHGVGIPEAIRLNTGRSFAAELHRVYKVLFSSPSSKPVTAWRICIDTGKTLVVAGRGIHGDQSSVSLGNAANWPAKHLYAQLDLSEEEQALKRFRLATWNARSDKWIHEELDDLPFRIEEDSAFQAIAETVAAAEPQVQMVFSGAALRELRVRGAPLGPAGTSTSPLAERPHTSFGWVMRADLDGFTARVEECFDKDEKLSELANQFYCIMDAAAEFASRHEQDLAQLPWAGDNFTAAAIFSEKSEYDKAAPRRLVDLSLDFELEMDEAAQSCGFGGWAHGVAGGDVHGNSAGNFFLAGVEIGGCRFLVGAGEGVGRSAQAFADVDPKAGDIVLYRPDWEQLHKPYKDAFEQAVNVRGQPSTLYMAAKASTLLRGRAREEADVTVATVPLAGQAPKQVQIRPHSR